MTLPSHLLLGAIVGTATGDPITAIAVSALVDVDHLYSYAKHGVLWRPKQFWKTITDKADPYGDQRGYLHNIVVAAGISALTFLINPAFGITFTAAYFGHLLLDALDTSDYWIFYPNKSVNLRGFVDYYSKQEILFDIGLLIILAILLF